MSKNCEQCGQEYVGQGKRFCSSKCYEKSRGLRLSRICKHCGDEFSVIQSKSTSSFCSRTCYFSYRKTRATKVCETCGKEFPSRPKQRFCSKVCMGKAERTRVAILCTHCGKEIFRNPYRLEHHKTHFCSRECHDDFQRRSRISLTCQECGKEFEVIRTRRETARACSKSCANKLGWRQKKEAGWQGKKVERLCETCGKSQLVYPSLIAQHNGNGGRFCSSECFTKWVSQNLRGQNHPNWKKMGVECDFCGDRFYCFPSKLNRQQHVFCSMDCYQKAKSTITKRQWAENEEYRERMTGETHPSWRHGHGNAPHPLDFNDALKEVVRELDGYHCVRCQTQGNGESLSVHHIDYDKLNSDTQNLISMCRSCHTKTNYNRRFWQIVLKSAVRKRTQVCLLGRSVQTDEMFVHDGYVGISKP